MFQRRADGLRWQGRLSLSLSCPVDGSLLIPAVPTGLQGNAHRLSRGEHRSCGQCARHTRPSETRFSDAAVPPPAPVPALQRGRPGSPSRPARPGGCPGHRRLRPPRSPAAPPAPQTPAPSPGSLVTAPCPEQPPHSPRSPHSPPALPQDPTAPGTAHDTEHEASPTAVPGHAAPWGMLHFTL